MGYTVAMFVAPAGMLVETLGGGDARPTHPWVEGVDLDEAAARVAAAVAAGGRHLDDDAAAFVVATIAQVGHQLGDLFHTSGGGDDFRQRLLGGILAPRFGAERIARLLLGPIAGCTFPDYPSAGMWTPDEAAAALAQADGVSDDEFDGDDAQAVHMLRQVARRGVDHGLDVLAVYA